MGPVNRRTLSRCGLLLAAWLLATASGPCAFFKPAEPEGFNSRPIDTDYHDPTHTLLTLARGMVDKTGNGQTVYLSTFAESTATDPLDGQAYRALFDVRDLEEQHEQDPFWTRELEGFVFNYLVQHFTLPYEMTWEPYFEAGNESGSLVDSLLHRKYRIVTVSQVGATTTRTTIAVGLADLYFVKSKREPDKWRIATWQDFRALGADSAFSTLGLRRLQSR
jgi:hypothetical protein